MNIIKFAGILASLALAGQASASGFEKSIMFGGQSAGLAGIATPYSNGAEALYFNPAGLATDKRDFALDVSPTMPKFTAPVTGDNTSSDSKSQTLVPFGIMYAHPINDKLGVGVGYYVSGGSGADYPDQEIAGLKGTLEAKSQLIVSEASLGVGYKLSENLKIGASYRVVMVTGDFAFLQPLGTLPGLGQTVGNEYLSNLKGTNYGGFKVGAQYKLSDSTQLGLTYRSNTPMRLKGQARMDLHGVNAQASGTTTDISALTTFPDAWTLGVKSALTETWNVYGEYAYTTYSRVQNVQIDGPIMVGTNAINNGHVQLNWHDQHNIRVAGEYHGFMMPIRFGYGWTSQVGETQFAKPSLIPPGPAQTYTLGTGINAMDGLKVNGAVEYTTVDGTGSRGDTGTFTGDYKVRELAIHLGLNYSY